MIGILFVSNDRNYRTLLLKSDMFELMFNSGEPSLLSTSACSTLLSHIVEMRRKMVVISNEDNYNKVKQLYAAKQYDLLEQLYYTLKEEEDSKLYNHIFKLIETHAE